jgi:hypothetical protein
MGACDADGEAFDARDCPQRVVNSGACGVGRGSLGRALCLFAALVFAIVLDASAARAAIEAQKRVALVIATATISSPRISTIPASTPRRSPPRSAVSDSR